MASTLQKDQQLRFRWNDHIHHLSKLLVSQRVEEQFCDATIISEDGYVLKGHQAVLSTTSGYFHDVLKDVTSDQHPIIVLNGINYMEFSCLMEYIYQGFTQVDQQFIESVLDAADILEVKGLSKMKSNPSLKKLIRTTDTQSPIATPQYFYPSPSPHYSSSPPANSSPLHICPSSTKIDNLQEDETIDADVQQEGSNDENVMNEKNAHKSIVNYGECDTSETVNSSDNNYSDQTSGIDLSISRSCVKDSTHFLSVDEEVSKKRKLIKLDDNVNNTLSDPDWGRISEKNDNLCPPKRKKFVKKETTYGHSVLSGDSSSSCENVPAVSLSPTNNENDVEDTLFSDMDEELNFFSADDDFDRARAEFWSSASEYCLNSSNKDVSDYVDINLLHSKPLEDLLPNSQVESNKAPLSKSAGRTSEKIKKPLNQYFLFFKDVSLGLRKHASTAKTLAKIVSDIWKSLPPVVKNYYRAWANFHRIEHRRMYPDYNYFLKEKMEATQSKKLEKLQKKNMYRVFPIQRKT